MYRACFRFSFLGKLNFSLTILLTPLLLNYLEREYRFSLLCTVAGKIMSILGKEKWINFSSVYSRNVYSQRGKKEIPSFKNPFRPSPLDSINKPRPFKADSKSRLFNCLRIFKKSNQSSISIDE